jgi:cytochrome P450 family 142 subfamily A polypeptide 1
MTQTLPGIKPDVDLADGRFYSDGGAREAYRWMRANEPVFRDRNGLAAAAGYRAVLDAERNPELFSSAGGIRPDQPGMPYMIDMDDPAHLLRRKLVNSGFTRKRVMDKVPSIEKLCDTLIDAVCERGDCDFVRDIAAPLPMAVIGDMLGVLPQERDMLLRWSDDLVCGLSSHVDDTVTQKLVETFAATPHSRRTRSSSRRSRHRRRRDHAAHVERRSRTAVAAPRSVGDARRQPGRHARCRRRDVALDIARQEHVPHADRRHGVPRHAAQGR